MLQRLILSLLCCCLLLPCRGQDLIIRKTGDTIKCRVTERFPGEIRYQKTDTPNAVQYVLLPSHIAAIYYADGHIDSLKDIPVSSLQQTGDTITDSYVQGTKDATRGYYGSGPAATGTLITSLLSPVIGLIPAIACSSTVPGIDNMGYRNDLTTHSPEYVKGYRKEAHKIKQRRVWTNWSIGLSVNLALALVFLSR